jgi:hypothetical protein
MEMSVFAKAVVAVLAEDVSVVLAMVSFVATA